MMGRWGGGGFWCVSVGVDGGVVGGLGSGAYGGIFNF